MALHRPHRWSCLPTRRPIARPIARAMVAAIVCVALLAFAPWRGSIVAQGATATLKGMVVDESGSLASEVEVTAIHATTGLRRKTTAGANGLFALPLLPIGEYAIVARKDGFTPTEIRHVQLNVGDELTIRVELKVAGISDAVIVAAEPSRVTTSPAVSTVIDRQFVESLPLNGRSFQSLILLTPGVAVASSGSTDYGQFSVNGQRASTNYFTVDGVSANVGISYTVAAAANNALAGAYPGLSALGGTSSLVSVDALEEYKIQTSTYAAEFGRQPGGQVSLVTRSGGNALRGTLFEYFRHDALDARDWFNAPPAPKPQLRQNQFGGTLGGPIVRGRTFFFFSYEGQRLRLPISGTSYVPSLRVRSAAVARIKPLLDATPLPTGDETTTTTPCDPAASAACSPATRTTYSGWSPFAYAFSNPGTMDATSIRVDHTFNSRLTMFGRFSESPSSITNYVPSVSSGPSSVSVIDAATRSLTLGATMAVSPRVINELRINQSRQLGARGYLPGTAGGAVPIDPELLTTGYGGFGTVRLTYNGRVADVQRGESTTNYQRQLNIVDNLSWARGAHQFKFGIDYRRLSPTYGPQDQHIGVFTAEADVINGLASSAYYIGQMLTRPRFTNFSAYAQDSWRATPRLTVDVGVRYELNPPPSEADGKVPALALGVTGNPPDVTQATLAPPGTPFYQTVYTAIAPRVGAAYQLSTASGRETVVRGGFGVYYDQGSAGGTNGYPLSVSSETLSGVAFPLSSADAARIQVPLRIPTSIPVTSSITANDEELTLPYTLQWNVAVERSLGARQAVSLSYVAAIGRKLLTEQNLNFPVGYTTGPRPNPNFTSITYMWNGATSDYHSLQTQYKARLSNGLQALVNYTWSHAIDDVSDDIVINALSRGNASFDVRHNLSAAVTYDLPAPRLTPMLTRILGNWTIDGIVHAQSGRPLGVFSNNKVLVDGMVMSVRPDVVPGVSFYVDDPSVPGGRRFNPAAFTSPPMDPTYPNVPARQGNAGRNILRELPLYQVDLALGRSLMLAKGMKLQFKGELFNIFNHPMFGNYGLVYTTPATFGVPTQMLRNSLTSFGPGLNPLYQMGGPRSVQLSLRLGF
jgi:outer membrane receptor protein involved in Fe transport